MGGVIACSDLRGASPASGARMDVTGRQYQASQQPLQEMV